MPRFRLLVVGIILVSFLLALFATISVEWAYGKLLIIREPLYDRFVLIVKDTVHKNVMAGNLILLLPVSLGLLFFTGREIRWWNRLLLAIVVLSVMGIYF